MAGSYWFRTPEQPERPIDRLKDRVTALASGRSLLFIAAIAAATLLGPYDRSRSAAPIAPIPYTEIRTRPPLPGAPIPVQPPTTDPVVLLTRMASFYANLDSLFTISEADMRQPGMKFPSHQVMTLKYHRSPAWMEMVVEDPLAGTHGYFADGTSVVTHDAMRNTYMRRDFHGDLVETARVVEHYAPQLLSPLIFIQYPRFSTKMEEARIVGMRELNGRPAYVLKGRFSEAYLRDFGRRFGFGGDVNPVKRDVTMWIDRETYALVKSTMSLAWNGVVKNANNRVVHVSPAVDVVNEVTTLVPNPKLSQEEFRFFPPPGAKQRFRERKND